jgi:hypothetical protein
MMIIRSEFDFRSWGDADRTIIRTFPQDGECRLLRAAPVPDVDSVYGLDLTLWFDSGTFLVLERVCVIDLDLPQVRQRVLDRTRYRCQLVPMARIVWLYPLLKVGDPFRIAFCSRSVARFEELPE